LHLFFLIFGGEEGFQSIVYIGRYFEHKSYLLSAILYDVIFSLLQKLVILIRKFNKEGPHLDKRKKCHLVNLDKLIWTYLR
jgi:hypothetical protein